MNKLGLLIIIAGPSGAGKSTVRSLVISDKSLNLAFSISSTTRAPRKGEKDGVDYFFISEKDFLNKIKKNYFLEYNKFVKNYYGTSKKQVDELRKKGKNVVLEIDINGTKNVMSSFKKNEIISFFIVPPSLKELEKRIRLRSTEDKLAIKLRLKRAKDELKEKDKFDYIIVNDEPKKAANKIIKIIKNAIAGRK